jgi:hypothetical protein
MKGGKDLEDNTENGEIHTLKEQGPWGKEG